MTGTENRTEDLNAVPQRIWACEDCGWRWPLKDAPYRDAECDACGGEMHPEKEAMS